MRRKSKGCCGNFQDIGSFLDHDSHVCCHPRKQNQIRILNLDHDCVADDILICRGLEANLRNRSVKMTVRVGVDSELGALAHLHRTNVGFIDTGLEEHPAQIVSNCKEVGVLKLAATV